MVADHPPHPHMHLHTHTNIPPNTPTCDATHCLSATIFFLRFLCLCLTAYALISSLLPTSNSPDTPPSHRALPLWNTFSLAQARSASVAIVTWLHALHPHQACVVVGKRQTVHVCLHQGEIESLFSSHVTLESYKYWYCREFKFSSVVIMFL